MYVDTALDCNRAAAAAASSGCAYCRGHAHRGINGISHTSSSSSNAVEDASVTAALRKRTAAAEVLLYTSMLALVLCMFFAQVLHTQWFSSISVLCVSKHTHCDVDNLKAMCSIQAELHRRQCCASLMVIQHAVA
jgi:hypothetical protein